MHHKYVRNILYQAFSLEISSSRPLAWATDTPERFMYVSGRRRNTLFLTTRPSQSSPLYAFFFILIECSSARGFTTIYPALCLVFLYFDPGFPSPTISFI